MEKLKQIDPQRAVVLVPLMMAISYLAIAWLMMHRLVPDFVYGLPYEVFQLPLILAVTGIGIVTLVIVLRIRALKIDTDIITYKLPSFLLVVFSITFVLPVTRQFAEILLENNSTFFINTFFLVMTLVIVLIGIKVITAIMANHTTIAAEERLRAVICMFLMGSGLLLLFGFTVDPMGRAQSYDSLFVYIDSSLSITISAILAMSYLPLSDLARYHELTLLGGNGDDIWVGLSSVAPCLS